MIGIFRCGSYGSHGAVPHIGDGVWVFLANTVSFSLTKDEKLWNLPSESICELLDRAGGSILSNVLRNTFLDYSCGMPSLQMKFGGERPYLMICCLGEDMGD